MMKLLESRTSARSPSSPEEEEQVWNFVAIVLNYTSVFSRVLASGFCLSIVFPRSAWACSSASQCNSLWSFQNIPAEVFAIATCIVAFITVAIIPLKNWRLEAVTTLIAFVFSIIDWSIVVSMEGDLSMQWAFSIAVAATALLLLSFFLSFRTRPKALPKSRREGSFSSTKPAQLLFSSICFSISLGAMPVLVNVASKSPQYQAGAYVAVAFLALQFMAWSLCLSFAVPPAGLSWTRDLFVMVQFVSIIAACISFGLLTNLNVLPIIIVPATLFHIQGFLLGGVISALMSLVAAILDRSEKQVRVPTGLHLFVSTWPHFLAIVSSGILGSTFGTLFVFVEQPSDSNASIVTSKACFVFACLLAFLLHVLVVLLLLRVAVSSNVILTMSVMLLDGILILIFISVSIGFATLVSATKTVSWFSAAMALTNLCLDIIFFLTFKLTSQVAMLRGKSRMVNIPQHELDSSSRVIAARQELEKEREALEAVRTRKHLATMSTTSAPSTLEGAITTDVDVA